MASALDALFMPTASQHENEEVDRNRRLCADIAEKLRKVSAANGSAQFSGFGRVGNRADSCERTASHVLGMTRAIQLKAQYESANAFKYDVVIVSRWNVL